MGRMICETCPSLDVRDLVRRGLFRLGLDIPLRWTCRGQLLDYASVHVEADSVVLLFRLHPSGANRWIDAEQNIPVVWTTCNFGGRRPWFLCTSHSDGEYCGRRVAILYRAGDVFACRR